MADQLVQIEHDGAVARVWLNREELRNAFNPEVISGLNAAFAGLSADETVRVVVLGGRGKVFCAGADLNWMREMARYSEEENLVDARRLAGMLRQINSCAKPVIARVQRAAFGGALGLMACCDSVICTDDSVFSFSEVRLGISPATIAPYVVARTGVGFARHVMLSGKRFDARLALSAGLVTKVVGDDELDAAVEAEIAEVLQAGPLAAAATKQLLNDLQPPGSAEVMEQTSQLIARLRASAEGQEGLAAFLEKREPGWRG